MDENDEPVKVPFLKIVNADSGIVRFTVFCEVCHQGLCAYVQAGTVPGKVENNIAGDDWTVMFIEPCPRCLEAAKKGQEVEVLHLNAKYNGWIDEEIVDK